VGTRAIGGFLAVLLALAGHSVSVVDRGTQLRAIRSRGLRLIEHVDGNETAVELPARGYFHGGPQDIIIAIKAHQITEVIEQIAALMHPTSMVVTVQASHALYAIDVDIESLFFVAVPSLFMT